MRNRKNETSCTAFVKINIICNVSDQKRVRQRCEYFLSGGKVRIVGEHGVSNKQLFTVSKSYCSSTFTDCSRSSTQLRPWSLDPRWLEFRPNRVLFWLLKKDLHQHCLNRLLWKRWWRLTLTLALPYLVLLAVSPTCTAFFSLLKARL